MPPRKNWRCLKKHAKSSDAFQALAAEALRSNNAAFLTLARETLEKHQIAAKGDLESRQKAIEQIARPLSESLGKRCARFKRWR
jgi:DNA recombination protein RmuC